MRIPMRAVGLAIAFALVAAPVADAQSTLRNPNESTPTTLYFHIFDTFNKFVINTQAMDAEFFEVGGTSFPTLVGTPVNEVTGDFDLNTIYGTSTAGPVEYDFIENGKPRFHPERGIAADVQIDSSVQPVVTMYVDVRDAISSGSLSASDGAPNALPDFTFRVTMREGDDPGTDADLDAGAPIMHGETTVHIFDGQTAAPANQVAGQSGQFVTPDENGIVEIQIPMTLDSDIIPKSEAFNVRIDWYQGGSAGFEDQFAEGYMRLYADPEHLPRLDFAINNPVYIEFIHPQVAAGILLIHTGVNSPWGTYDIDPSNITISIDGPVEPLNLEQVIAQNQHVHGLHDQAAEITYLWKFRDENAPNGEYTIDFSVPNAKGTAVATGSAGFVVQGKQAFGIDDKGEEVEPTVVDDEKKSPGAGLLAALGLVGAAFILRRRSV